MKILEEARKEKRIGKALEARVKLTVPEETASLLRAYEEAALPEVLNVSQVEIAGLPSGETTVQAEVGLANGDRPCVLALTHDVPGYGAWPRMLTRCQSALSEMNIQPPAPEEVKA